MFDRLRWLTILLPALLVGAIELLSDSVFDEWVPVPWDAAAVVTVVLVLSFAFSKLAFRRIDALAGALASRNAELEAKEASARALHRVSVAIATMGDPDTILQAIVDQARELLRADLAVLLLTGPDGALTFRAGSAPDGALHPRGDLPGDDVLRFVPAELAAARLAAPLQRAAETIGLLAVGARIARGFGVVEVETLSSLANQAAIAIENARLQGRLRELAVVAERERIAREMHDGLAQVLGYVNTKSQAVEEHLAAGRTAEARGQLSELAAAARSIYVDVREAILGLRSPIAPGTGFVAAVEEYAQRFADASKLAVRVDATAAARDLELAPDVQAQAFRIIQESLTNVRKHATAHRASVTIAVDAGDLVVSIEDDGRGLLPADVSAAGWPHYGQQAMRERAADVGGSVEWSSPGTSGAVVRLVVPLGTRAPGAAVAAGVG
jgi:signal transduction histidine kinase